MASYNQRYKQFSKNVATERGFNYNFVAIEPIAQKPTLVFLHGFPSHSNDWHHQIDYFQAKGAISSLARPTI